MTRGYGRFNLLPDEERQAFFGAMRPAQVLQSGEDLAMEGDRATGCTIVLDGVLCRYKLLSEGKRQILGFPIAGDLIGPAGLMLGRMDHSVRALTPATVATIPRHTFLDLVATQPHIAQAIWREVLVDASIAHEWLANVGQRPAYHRIAHLICEMRVRFEAAGIATGPRFAWPITQGHMAEATGLSSVHVNRVLQQLRADRLITLALGVLTIHDWAALQRVGDFTPDYLFLNSRAGDAQATGAVCELTRWSL